MARIVKEFIDGSHLEYDRGSIDNWCVYMVDINGIRKPPLDTDYFNRLYALASEYGNDRVYEEFVEIYDLTTKDIDITVLDRITSIASLYPEEISLGVDKLYTTLYMAMTAEENYPNTRLGRKIKRLGVYEMLYGNRSVKDAANFMRGMNWRTISDLCRDRGF